jgi:A/G-specific adenine glycosylase
MMPDNRFPAKFRHYSHAGGKQSVLTGRLLDWYAREKRNLPWRRTRDPYRIWVSEIMLQQTQVETVIPFYRRFMKAFPTIRDLANSSSADVLKIWENMGYYARARNLRAAARDVVARFDGKFPVTREAILSLPGIGPYTAGAIMSIAFGKPETAVDGNVCRVFSRLFAIEEPVDKPSARKLIKDIAQDLLPAGKAGDFNQALMDLGATLCIPKGPSCGRCPVADLCMARSKGLQNMLPAKSKKRTQPHKEAAAAVIRRGGKLLVVQRPEKGLLGGLWKLPGGFRVDGEGLHPGLARHVREEVGIEIGIGEEVASVDHVYTHFRVTIHAFRCHPLNGARPARNRAGWRWMDEEEISRAAFSKADRKILSTVFPDGEKC